MKKFGLLFLLLVSFSGCFMAQGKWTPPSDLSGSLPGYAYYPTPVQITCCENRFVATWIQLKEEEPFYTAYASFSSNGTSWTLPHDLSGSLSGYAYQETPVQITCCENGFVATWIQIEDVEDSKVYASFSPDGTSWTRSDLSGSLPGYSYPTSQQITCCENRFVATWIQIEDKEPFYTVYASFSPNGTSWTRSDLSGLLPGYAYPYSCANNLL